MIPTANRHHFLNDIFINSLIPNNQIILIRTSPGPHISRVHNIFVKSKKINIQKWWNLGIKIAEKQGAKYVAVLNDDVWISPGSLQKMAFEAFIQDVPLVFPFPHSGQLAGYCWVLNLKYQVRPDEQFRWWYGDNDLQMQAQKLNKYIYVPVDVKHLESGESTAENPFLQELAEIDHYKFIQKWGTKKQQREARNWKFQYLKNKFKTKLKIFK